LIKDHLINSKLVNGLNNLGIDATPYFLHLGETVFMLIGFEDDLYSDEIYRQYLKMLEKINNINISKEDDRLNELVKEIYRKLIKLKLV
ncbi:MAG: hypothetical protein ACXVP4_13680, partial [Bacteroidia bacterium]